jgi:hypothetical protein
MLLTAHVDACTTKFYFCHFFLAVPIFTSRETSEKIPTEWLFLPKIVVLGETYLALGCWYHQAADVAQADDQTGLPSSSSLTRAHREIALGVYGTAVPTPLQVTLRGPCGTFPAIDDWCVAMMLTWPWWSLEGSLLMGVRRIGHSPKKEVLVFVVTP